MIPFLILKSLLAAYDGFLLRLALGTMLACIVAVVGGFGIALFLQWYLNRLFRRSSQVTQKDRKDLYRAINKAYRESEKRKHDQQDS